MIISGHWCSGYDGLGMALSLAGVKHEAAWHSELDPDASAILRRVEPGVLNAGDLRIVDWSLAPAVDIATAGFPCQPVSVQGAKKGKADKRWLWPDIRFAYRAVQPWRLFLENVGNLATIEGGRLLDEILRDLRADGYEARWGIVGACAVGAAHHRHRWFLVADRVGPGAREAVRALRPMCGFPRSRGRLLPTPRAGDERRGVEPDRAARTGTGPTLNDAVGTLPPGTWGIYSEAVRRHSIAMGDPSGLTVPEPVNEAGQLRGEFSEWLMMLPAGHITTDLQRQDAVRIAGNGVVPLQAAEAYRLLTS